MNTAKNQSLPILLVDDEPQILLGSQMLLRTSGIENIATISDSRELMPFLASHEAGVIVLDLSMPHLSGYDLLAAISSEYPHIPVILMTAVNDLETAVSCMKSGAFDYLLKPVDKDRFITCITRAMEIRALQTEMLSLKDHLLTDELENASVFSPIVTRSKKMRAIFRYVEAVSNSRQPVLITGETGVGKELIARAIHAASGIKGSFVPVNIGGLDDTMISDSLFGHRKGAFTGADEAREGMIAQAAGGTLLLDEIGDLTESTQVKLLRLIQERTYYPLGSDMPRRSDARILVATNRDIQQIITSGKFRKDLYYRLRAHHIHIPPLRERREDIPMLLHHFLEKSALLLNRKKPSFPPELVTLLANYHFPGNVRELEMMALDASALCTGGIIAMESFRRTISGPDPSADRPSVNAIWDPNSEVLPTLKEAEEFLIAESMRRSGGNQGTAASLLGITRQALNKRLSRERKKL
ncbi:MAG TPA: sigma-54 dependent transcriptional regulator [Dissulfurispiraceae bacterium]|nr:sigma-54 dependent transcriptional regulator [Dissulfurispiraceae bacterium]